MDDYKYEGITAKEWFDEYDWLQSCVEKRISSDDWDTMKSIQYDCY